MSIKDELLITTLTSRGKACKRVSRQRDALEERQVGQNALQLRDRVSLDVELLHVCTILQRLRDDGQAVVAQAQPRQVHQIADRLGDVEEFVVLQVERAQVLAQSDFFGSKNIYLPLITQLTDSLFKSGELTNAPSDCG